MLPTLTLFRRIADSATACTLTREPRIDGVEFVTIDAMRARFIRIGSWTAMIATSHIFEMRHRFEMAWIHTCSIATEMIEFQA